jgi:ubiquitin-conjugating enzyme E2 J2
MATRAAHKRLTKEYATLSAKPIPLLSAHPSESNILEWHYILTGPPDTPYDGGQYWGTLVFPPDYPFAPPAIRMHTPSGRFRCSERLCLSISDFHPKSFNPAWEVSTILLGVLSFMTSEEMTTGSLSATLQERKALAAQTRWWNSTGGGSTNRTIAGQQPTQSSNTRGFGAIKAGDGGKRFREHWPEVDEENWKWMEEKRIDPRTGKSPVQAPSCSPEATALRRRAGGTTGGLGAVVEGGREVGAAGQGWVRRNAWYIILGGLFCYVLIMRLVGQRI